MKWRLLFIVLLAWFGAYAQPTSGTYTPINQSYNWYRGYFRGLHLPAGSAPTLQTGQWSGSGAIYVDTVGGGLGLWYYLGGTWYHALDSATIVGMGGGGSGTVSPGLANKLAYYPSSGTTIDDLPGLTGNRAMITDATGLPNYSTVTNVELAYLGGTTSSVQTQLDNKQPLDADLTTIAGLTATTDNFIQSKAGAWASRTIAQVKSDLGLSGTNTGDQTISLTGDATGSGTGSLALTLANTGVTAGSCTSCDLTIDSKGRVTAKASGSGGAASITVGTSTLTGGTNQRVPFNDGGVYNEDAGLTFNKTTDALTIGGNIFLPNSTSTKAAIYINGNSYLTNYGPLNDNIALGEGAGSISSVSSNRRNVSIGYGAGSVVQSLGNTFIGNRAGESFTAAVDPANDGDNIAIGDNAMVNATGARNSIFIGPRAGEDVTTGSYSNTAIGKYILEKCTTCAANSMYGASQNLIDGINNSAIGADILVAGTSASYNSLSGMFSYSNTTTGSYNVGSGYFGAYNNTTGSHNVNLGDHSLYTNVTGSNNIALGDYALAFNSTDSYMFSVHSGNGGTFGKALIGGDLQNAKACIGCREDSIKLWGATLAVIGDLRVRRVDSVNAPQNMLYVTQEGYIQKAAVPSTSSAIVSGTTSVTSGTDTRVFFQDGSVISQDAGLVYNKTTNILSIDGVNIGRGTVGEITNTAVGNGAGNAWTTATNSTAFGYQVLNAATTGTGSAGFGYRALASNVGGAYNHAFGMQVLEANVSGNYNTGAGAQTLKNNTGTGNSGFGFQVFLANTSGGQGAAFGYASLSNNTTGVGNSALGYNSGLSNTTGSNNFYGGYGTTGPTTGSNNTIVGALINIGNVSNYIAIGNGGGNVKAQHDGTDWTLTGKVNATGAFVGPAATTSTASFIAPNGTAPSSPTQGMIWQSSNHLMFRSNDGNSYQLDQQGGMTNPLTTTGDIIYSSSGTTAARLGIGATNKVLQAIGGVPVWGPVITSGTYTPTITNGTNVSSSSNGSVRYTISGSTVTVIGSIGVTATAAGVNTVVSISLPTAGASNFAASTDASGIMGEAAGFCGIVTADATNDLLVLTYVSGTTSSRAIPFSISYDIIP